MVACSHHSNNIIYIGRNTRGPKHHLLVDRAVAQNCKTRLASSWIDYMKAYTQFDGDVANNTAGQFQANSTSIGFTKEILLPHCYSAWTPSVRSLRRLATIQWYRLWNGAIVSHLLYMNDIKLYARSEQDIDSLIHTTRMNTNNIRMSVRLVVGW